LAVAKDIEKNNVQQIPCSGTPVGGYVYDVKQDCYYASCVAYHIVGSVPFSCAARIKNNNSWQMYVPLPENVFVRYLNKASVKNLKFFKSLYKDCEFITMQLVQ
jgi:hypothetical protein